MSALGLKCSCRVMRQHTHIRYKADGTIPHDRPRTRRHESCAAQACNNMWSCDIWSHLWYSQLWPRNPLIIQHARTKIRSDMQSFAKQLISPKEITTTARFGGLTFENPRKHWLLHNVWNLWKDYLNVCTESLQERGFLYSNTPKHCFA